MTDDLVTAQTENKKIYLFLLVYNKIIRNLYKKLSYGGGRLISI